MNLEQYLATRARDVPRVASRESGEWSAAARARGRDVIELSGAPLTLPGENVIEAAAQAARDYCKAPSRGLPELREAIAAKVAREQNFVCDPDTEVLVTAGAMEGLNVLATALLDPGDEVLVTAPGFFYHGIVELAGGTCVYVPTRQEDEFGYDLGEFDRAITPRTKLLMLANPNNPTGHVATRQELAGLAELAERHDFLIVSDDSYERMVYDGRDHISLASLDGITHRVITVQSFTKSYAMPGWRVGYVIAPQPLLDTFVKVHEWILLNCGYVEQKAASEAMNGPQDWVDAIRAHLESCRNAMCDGLSSIDELSFIRPKGGPFVCVNVSRCGMSSREFARYILDEYGVRSEPGENFEAPGYIRLAFGAKDPATSSRAASQIRSAVEALRK
ncbi:MAG: aminotransferase class I/II-fold pyridoxal phosphate-dependent enzyme [Nitrospiraceae bacterium]|nr:aminotransferase class I/II-fold pyridoxal phosphate-dependent enzyme [Nitrospiraceae bacterium]